MNAIAVTSQPPFVSLPAWGEVARMIARREHRAKEALHCHRPVPPPFDCLSDDLAFAVSLRWREPCEAAFEFILAHDPSQLALLIKSRGLHPGDLTFAAEILGRSTESNRVRAVLVPLLRHEEAVVREGAIYGLAAHLDAVARDELSRLATSDRSAAVRTAAGDALDA